MPTALKFGKWLATVVTVLVLTIYFSLALDARRMPPLGPEHRIEFDEEFDASMEDATDWPAYLALEDKLAAELEQKIPSDARPDSPADRYFANSLTYPGNFDGNWNHSYELTVPAPRGIAVLLHGLTDSPYSMLATAQTLAGAGYNVVAARMPGHGFAVAGLVQARWEDWTAAVRIAVRRAMQRPGAEQSLLLVGYSNGGLLAVDYALQCEDSTELPCPDGLVLLSPGIAITSAAAVMNWHAVISWLPYFEKFKWLSVLPEIDPFKFTSFPKRAAWEVHKISSRVHERLADPLQAARLPPVLTFQSVVDDTVGATAIVTTLYQRLPANGSKLVLYDVNRNSTMLHLMKKWPEDPARYFTSMAPLDFGVTILKNRDASSNAIDAVTLPAEQTEAVIDATKLRWPTQMYSLSHIAIPFRADDTLYGNGAFTNNPNAVLGALAPRGERGLLKLTPEFFLRIRYNPFYEFQSALLTEWLDEI
ncbi:MAG: lysophospholipase [Gammaproteobacteria bacterium]|nr:lysophospholipase [Gammaproteobacteria bacterium]MDH3409595.1 lysophospholipase [Gammaproteobacteria bacterium]